MSLKRELQAECERGLFVSPIKLLAARCGEDFEAAPYTGERRTMKECFQNAMRHARMHNLRYVEGIAHRMIPVHHAWCVDEKGYVVDPTWNSPENALYCGIAFDQEEAVRECVAWGYFSLFDSPYGMNWDLIEKLAPGLKEECEERERAAHRAWDEIIKATPLRGS